MGTRHRNNRTSNICIWNRRFLSSLFQIDHMELMELMIQLILHVSTRVTFTWTCPTQTDPIELGQSRQNGFGQNITGPTFRP